MRRIKASKRGRLVPILVAGGVGYLIGAWPTAGLRSTDLSAAETVAQRFPQTWNDAPAGASALAVSTSSGPVSSVAISSAGMNSAPMTGGVQFALLSPEPMVPQVNRQTPPQAAVQTAALEQMGPAPAATDAKTAEIKAAEVKAAAAKAAEAKAAEAKAAALNEAKIAEAKAAAAAARRRANRPGYMLDDAQIASIKERLNLTPDQERMWPAVEVALRNIAYAHAQDARHGGSSATQSAALDSDSIEVQGLKSAATPLLMSFNSDQKAEVRNLAHVMGLDQLATQF
jgi:hypothetical protein